MPNSLKCVYWAYQKTKTPHDAIAELEKGVGAQFSPNITKIFIDYLHRNSLKI